tara:strand:+ start:210 stop:2573 length:2364 start_codon:yes stop_codon:yes gene_type:complete
MSNYQSNQSGWGTPEALQRLTSFDPANFNDDSSSSSSSSSSSVDAMGYANPFEYAFDDKTRKYFQMDKLTNDQAQVNTENQLFHQNNNIKLRNSTANGVIAEENTAEILKLINNPANNNLSNGNLTLVVFLWQHGTVCNFARNDTPKRLIDRLKMSSDKIWDPENLLNSEHNGTAVGGVGDDSFALENLWVANLASPGAVLATRGTPPIEDFVKNIQVSTNADTKIKILSDKLLETHPISNLYKLIDRGSIRDIDCFDFSVSTKRKESDRMGLTKILGGDLTRESNKNKRHFLQQSGMGHSGQVPENDGMSVMFSHIIKQTISEVAAANYGLDHLDFVAGDADTLGITNILFINATCQAMNGSGPAIAVDSLGTFDRSVVRRVNPLYLGRAGRRKTRSRRKKRKDIRKRKKKTNKSRRKTRRKKRKKRKQRKKNTRKKWELRGGKCTDAGGKIFGDYFKPDYDRCMKNNNRNNKISKTYCCAAAINSRADFRKREKQREINMDVERWEEEEKGDLRDQRRREQRRITNFHQQRNYDDAQTKKSMRLWDEWEGKEKKKFYDSFKEERKSLLKKMRKRLNTQQQTILKQEGVAAQIKIIVKQTKEFINQMNQYVATKLGGWSQGIQQQKNRWETEQQQLLVKQQQQVKQQGINLKDPQSTVNGLNQQLEFLFNQLYNGIDEDILKDYAFAKAREEDIKIIKRQLQASGQNYIPAPGTPGIQQSINLRRMYPTFTQNLNMAFNKYPPSDDDDLSAFVAFNSIYPRNNNQSMGGGKRKKKTKRRRKKKSRC